jgi:hypothetical protein
MIIARHSAELCPGGVVRPNKEAMGKVEEAMNGPGVKVVEGYLDGPGHAFYFVVETNDNVALNNALEPLRHIGEVDITPVLKLSDARMWLKEIGIQK